MYIAQCTQFKSTMEQNDTSIQICNARCVDYDLLVLVVIVDFD